MISVFHPNILFCNKMEWDIEDFQDEFVQNLISHLDIIEEFDIKIAWSDEFYNLFWQKAPWIEDCYFKNYMIDYVFNRIENHMEIYTSPPDDPCSISQPFFLNNLNESKISFLILLHRLLFRDENVKIVVRKNTYNEIDKIEVYCDCISTNNRDNFILIKNEKCWFNSLNYLDKWPVSMNNWDKKFKQALSIYKKQKFPTKKYLIPIDNVEFTSNFKEKIIVVNNNSKKRTILKNIIKILILTHQEAGRDHSLREEKINDQFRFRISDSERIHYFDGSGKKIFLEYYTSGEHDIGLL